MWVCLWLYSSDGESLLCICCLFLLNLLCVIFWMLFLCTGTSTPTWRRCWETSPAAGRSLSDGWNGSLKSRPGTLTSTLSCATRRWRKPAPFMSDISFCCFTNMQDTGNCFPTVKFKQYNKTLKYRNKKRDQGDGLSSLLSGLFSSQSYKLCSLKDNRGCCQTSSLYVYVNYNITFYQLTFKVEE